MVVGWRFEASPEIHAVMGDQSRTKIIRRAILALDRYLSLQYSFLPWSRDFLDHPFIQTADVIHLHNLHGGYFPYRVIPKLSRIAPLVWSLHDMWAMTGHCAYSYECERWKSGCGRCPILGEYPPIYTDTTRLHWRIKDRTYRNARMTIVAGSMWMAGMAKQSPLLNRFAIHTIPYGTDVEVFRPTNKAHARKMLRLPESARVILVFASSEHRKGWTHLLAALDKLGVEPRPWLLVAGDRLGRTPAGFSTRRVGYVDSDDLLNLCYVAADIFVLPTLADNLPLSVLDALAAGTPSVVFDVGGVPDLIRHLETGYLVSERSPEGLAQAMGFLLMNREVRLRIGENARRAAEQEYSMDTYARRYLSLYEKIIQANQLSLDTRA
jgi:glycosyltransferase involved in cell wall biosynthesis